MPYPAQVYSNGANMLVFGGDGHDPLISFDGGITFYTSEAIMEVKNLPEGELSGVLLSYGTAIWFHLTPLVVEALGIELTLTATSFNQTGAVIVDEYGNASIGE